MPEDTVQPSLPYAAWERWRRTLSRWGAVRSIIVLLEAAGPLTVLGAQFLYLGQPFFGQGPRQAEWQALAKLLEDDKQQRLFIRYLQENESA